MAAGPAAAPRRAHPRTRPTRRTTPRAPRRVSGPARHARPPRAVRSSAPAVALPAPTVPVLPKLADVLRGLPDARWLDRLLRGQGWIVLIAVALIGIVAMQVSLLKLNAGIGQSIERSGALERQNADLRAEVSKLSSEERIQQVAERLGLLMPPAGDVRYVTVRGAEDGAKAAKVMHAPTPDEPAAPMAATGASATAIAQGEPQQPASTTPPPATTATPAPAPQSAPPAEQPPPAAQDQAAPPASGGATAAPVSSTAPGQ